MPIGLLSWPVDAFEVCVARLQARSDRLAHGHFDDRLRRKPAVITLETQAVQKDEHRSGRVRIREPLPSIDALRKYLGKTCSDLLVGRSPLLKPGRNDRH